MHDPNVDSAERFSAVNLDPRAGPHLSPDDRYLDLSRRRDCSGYPYRSRGSMADVRAGSAGEERRLLRRQWHERLVASQIHASVTGMELVAA
jgi:hypothetical protein